MGNPFGEKDYDEDRKWLGSNEFRAVSGSERVVSAGFSLVDVSVTGVKLAFGGAMLNFWATDITTHAGKVECTGVFTKAKGSYSEVVGLKNNVAAATKEMGAMAGYMKFLDNGIRTTKKKIIAMRKRGV